MTLYKGSQKIRDTGSYGVYHGSEPIRAIYHGSDRVFWQQLSRTFNVSSSLQTYVVPKNVTKLRIDCVASKGGSFNNRAGGNGGRVQCILNVTPNQTLYIMVGGQSTAVSNPVYNASDIRIGGTSYGNRVIVAGGGGNSGLTAVGGAGGGLTGGNGGTATYTGTATGGTQSAGGKHGSASTFATNGTDGTLGMGGAGGGNWGGAGGAGYYGGGGGSKHDYAGTDGGGGGGGSSYTNSSYCSNVTHTQGYCNGNGYVTITEIG